MSLLLHRFSVFLRSLKTVLSKVDWVLLLIILLVGFMLGTLSVMRYTGYNAFMYDLGNMSQAIWSGTQGQPLEFTFEGGNISRLSNHVELFYWLLVPLYSLLPSPITLLIFQDLLFIAGAYPVYKLANRRLKSKTAARLITLTYLFYPVAQTAVLFDFHGDTLAMPLLLFALESLDRRSWKSFYFWLVLALSCKFYIAIPVAVLGIVLWLQGQRKVGIVTFLVATIWCIIAILIIRPMFSPLDNLGPVFLPIGGYFQYYFGNFLQDISSTLIVRIFTGLIIILPAILLGRRALLWILPAAAIAIPALISARGSSYSYMFHHYSLVVPFLLMAIIYGAERVQKYQFQANSPKDFGKSRNWMFMVIATILFTLLLNIFLVDTPMNPRFWISAPLRGLDPTKYGNLPRDRFKDQWILKHVPSDSPIAASMPLMAHLANRQFIYSIDYLSEKIGEIDYVIPDALMDYDYVLNGKRYGSVIYDSEAIKTLLKSGDFGLVASQDGLLLFQKEPPSERVLFQNIEVSQPEQPPTIVANFNQSVGLTKYSITDLGERRFRLQFEWILIQPLNKIMPFFAVSHLEGVDNARIVHLPTKVLKPTNTWEVGQIITEVFDIELPQDIPSGSYPLWVGWYDSDNVYAYNTDERSRLGEEVQVGNINLP